jgi:tRNA A-37 threonylcarbamoyl transferase component Bud32
MLGPVNRRATMIIGRRLIDYPPADSRTRVWRIAPDDAAAVHEALGRDQGRLHRGERRGSDLSGIHERGNAVAGGLGVCLIDFSLDLSTIPGRRYAYAND